MSVIDLKKECFVKTVIYALVFALMSTISATALSWDEMDMQSRIAFMRAEVASVRAAAGITEEVRVLSATKNEFGLSAMGWTNESDAEDGVYEFHVRERFLMQAPLRIIQHVVRHELCHIKHGHLKLVGPQVTPEQAQEMENEAERCALKIAGPDTYTSYVQAYESWIPIDGPLGFARKYFLESMRPLI